MPVSNGNWKTDLTQAALPVIVFAQISRTQGTNGDGGRVRTGPHHQDGPKELLSCVSLSTFPAGFGLEPCCRGAGPPVGMGRMGAVPTAMLQPRGGQGQILEGIEAHGSQLQG